ncbi:MAG TPA: DinB family protein [Cytophagaceae bacterium]|jgi:uncharacterized damage-inducible protein DinB
MRLLIFLSLSLSILSCSRKTQNVTVKSILLEQLRNTHTNKNWFVPSKIALENLTSEQANWKDSSGNHSIGELVSHLIFWNERTMVAFDGNKLPDFNEGNEITFKKYEDTDWKMAVAKLDSIQTRWEKAIEISTDVQLNKWGSEIANVCSHNAYHTGQIIFIRKQNGWWASANGVK